MQSLKKNKDFKKVYNRGKSYASKYLVLYKLKNNLKNNRYGFSISKKVANAVGRNKFKRRLREIIRELEKRKKIKVSYEVIFIARKPVIKLDYHQLKSDLVFLLKKMDLHND